MTPPQPVTERNGVALDQRRPPAGRQVPTERRALVVDVPVDADAELAGMAMLVAVLETLPPAGRARAARWAAERYGVPCL